MRQSRPRRSHPRLLSFSVVRVTATMGSEGRWDREPLSHTVSQLLPVQASPFGPSCRVGWLLTWWPGTPKDVQEEDRCQTILWPEEACVTSTVFHWFKRSLGPTRFRVGGTEQRCDCGVAHQGTGLQRWAAVSLTVWLGEQNHYVWYQIRGLLNGQDL